MREIYCEGTPYEIGLKHGKEAKDLVHGTIKFYEGLFLQNCKIDWNRVRVIASEFEAVIQRKWPSYLQEMKGLAEGAEVPTEDILAINVRTEINFGLFSDGCTSLSWATDKSSFLAQNWDWMEEQKADLIIQTIVQEGKPTIKMVTEAGIIGKIGLNSSGVGVCLNAIRAKGMDPTRMPCHLGLRTVLESTSLDEAVRKLERYGIASACHMLVADPNGSVGLEWSHIDVQKCTMDPQKRVFHSNHYLQTHPGVQDSVWISDSLDRVKTIANLADKVQEPTTEKVFDMFKDEFGWPAAICRSQKEPSGSATLFNIVMELKEKRAQVTLGRPTEPDERTILSF